MSKINDLIKTIEFVKEHDPLGVTNIDENGFVNFPEGRFTLANNGLKELPIKFGDVDRLYLSEPSLISTKGFPKSFKGFHIEFLKIKDFKEWNLTTSSNKLNLFTCSEINSLEGIENSTFKKFIIYYCSKLKTLDFMPTVDDFFYVSDFLELENIDGAKDKVKCEYHIKLENYPSEGYFHFTTFEQFKSFFNKVKYKE